VTSPPAHDVDAIIVSYNSADCLRDAVESLDRIPGVRTIVVDNDSSDDSLATIADLEVTTVDAKRNGGFAAGCNLGWPLGTSPYVLFLNPDARIDQPSLERLAALLDGNPRIAVAAPKILGSDGTLQHSLRRFPRLRSTYAQALYLHRLAPTATWSDEIIRSREHYDRGGPQQWVSGACMLVRRSALEELGGWDSGFFLYCEDIDLCRRVQDAGLEVHYEPAAVARHQGGASASRASTLQYLAASRVRYAFAHRSRPAAFLECVGIALEACTRFLTLRDGVAGLAGHARSLWLAVGGAAGQIPAASR
jgi:GT2 family glycosyltransferase